jgi:hypothetical protein
MLSNPRNVKTVVDKVIASKITILFLISGISDFWTDDYKVFEQVYGKTSDKDLYSDNLPISHTNIDKYTRPEASDKKERYITNHALTDFGEKYAKLFSKQILDEDKTLKPAKSINFLTLNDFKPINQHSDPEMYDYLKHLEQYNKKKLKLSKGLGGFKPYADDSGDSQVYKSIQDILDAHEANKGAVKEADDDDSSEEPVKYVTYGTGKGRKKSNLRPKPGQETMKPRCWSGRCRKRAASGLRVRTRPYVRKITQSRWTTG